jgi:hypothetical protein
MREIRHMPRLNTENIAASKNPPAGRANGTRSPIALISDTVNVTTAKTPAAMDAHRAAKMVDAAVWLNYINQSSYSCEH